MPKQIPLHGKRAQEAGILFAIVDDRDFARLSQHRWCLGTYGYPIRGIRKTKNGKTYHSTIAMHREIMGDPAGMDIDHRNKPRHDNRRRNIRACATWQNMQNRKEPYRTNKTSPYKGVYKESGRNGRFTARICINGQRLRLGLFRTAEEAKRCLDEFAMEAVGEFASPVFR